MRRLIIFLIRKKLGVKIGEGFRFTNQKTTDMYYFTPDGKLMKYVLRNNYIWEEQSRVSLNWILDDECKVVLMGK